MDRRSRSPGATLSVGCLHQRAQAARRGEGSEARREAAGGRGPEHQDEDAPGEWRGQLLRREGDPESAVFTRTVHLDKAAPTLSSLGGLPAQVSAWWPHRDQVPPGAPGQLSGHACWVLGYRCQSCTPVGSPCPCASGSASRGELGLPSGSVVLLRPSSSISRCRLTQGPSPPSS